MEQLGVVADEHQRLLARDELRGADHLVVGRPITGAGDPAAVAAAILDEIATL